MDKEIEYDILMEFNYDGNDYVIYTDNSYDEEGKFNLYGASLDSEGRLREVEDVDMDDVFDMMINRYRESILKGEI